MPFNKVGRKLAELHLNYEIVNFAKKWRCYTILDRMDNGTLCDSHPQRQRYYQQPQRLDFGNRQPEIYFGFAVEYHQRECANGGDCRGITESGVLVEFKN